MRVRELMTKSVLTCREGARSAGRWDEREAPRNPTSLGWSLEMWGYGWLGVATWLVAPVFNGDHLERATRWTFLANGPLSVIGAFWTAFQPGWVMTGPGMAAFASWNLLVVVMASLALAVFRARARSCSI